jgi:hypothetical protein
MLSVFARDLHDRGLLDVRAALARLGTADVGAGERA